MPVAPLGGSIALSALLPGDADRYIALYEDAACTQEIDVPEYARVAYTGWVTAGDGMSRSNTAPITWPVFTSGGQFSGLAVMDSAVDGSRLWYTSVKTLLDEDTVVVEAGDYAEIAAGGLSVGIS